jgi:hypothetical protein
MFLNVVFFTRCVFLVYSTKYKIENKSTALKDLILYTRLALIMGLNWITGIIDGIVYLEGIVCSTLR